jgi:hypothetical protein
VAAKGGQACEPDEDGRNDPSNRTPREFVRLDMVAKLENWTRLVKVAKVPGELVRLFSPGGSRSSQTRRSTRRSSQGNGSLAAEMRGLLLTNASLATLTTKNVGIVHHNG